MRLTLPLTLLLVTLLSACGSRTMTGERVTHHPAGLAFRSVWSHAISPNADSAPAYASHPIGCLPVHGNARCARPGAMVYVLAGNNGSNCSPGNPVRRATLYAFDSATGKLRWTRSTTGPSRCTTAGPVVDPNQRWVYAPGLDGRIHRYNAASGSEAGGSGWPHPVTLIPDFEKVASTPTIRGQYLYVATSGFIGDQGHYEGHLATVNLRSGQEHVFNSLCSNIHRLLVANSSASNYCSAVQSGLFGRGQGVVDPVSHDVYIVSGNGPWNGRTNWGDSVLKLDPSGQRLLDSYTPTNQAALNSGDLDLGSTGPALLAPIKQRGHTYHLLVQGGKGPACGSCSGTALRLLNRDNLSGKGRIGHLGGDLQDVQTPGGSEVLTAPAIWQHAGQDWAFYANDSGLAGYRVTSPSRGTFRLQRAWLTHQGGTTPVMHGGILYVAHDGAVNAYNPLTGAVLASAPISNIHWEYPLVAGGRLFTTDERGRIAAFTIKG